MFGIGAPELLVIAVLALIIFGPETLPEIASQVDKAIRDFRRMSDELTGEFNRTMQLDAPPPETALDPAVALIAADEPPEHVGGAGQEASSLDPDLPAQPPGEIEDLPGGIEVRLKLALDLAGVAGEVGHGAGQVVDEVLGANPPTPDGGVDTFE